MIADTRTKEEKQADFILHQTCENLKNLEKNWDKSDLFYAFLAVVVGLLFARYW